MSSSPARGPLSSMRLTLPNGGGSSSIRGDTYASISISPRRKASRPAIAEEGVRHCEDVPLPLWSISPRRTLSPASRNRKVGFELSSSALLESGGAALLTSAAAGANLSFSSPLSPASGALVQLPPSAFEDPDIWEREYVQLRSRFVRPTDAVTVFHDYTSPLNSRATLRHACVVRPLPDLAKVQEALRRRYAAQKSAVAAAYDVLEQQCHVATTAAGGASAGAASANEDTVSVAAADDASCGTGLGSRNLRGAHGDQRNDTFIPAARTWCVGGSSYDNEVVVYGSTSGQRLMRILDPKMKVAVTALQHAPFRAFVESQQLHVLPVREPQDVLRLKAAQLVYTDYVWCGLQDGTLRLLPASHHHIRACGPSPPYSKSPSAHLVYELPRYQGGAIVSIVCSPCHDDVACDDPAAPSAMAGGGCPLHNRVSEAVRCMTAAAAAFATAGSKSAVDGSVDGVDPSRRHLSLVCTASTDATVLVWDMRTVYEAVAQAQQQQQQQQRQHDHHSDIAAVGGKGLRGHGGAPVGTTASNDVITFDCSSPIPGLQNMIVRSSCTLLQVRPVAKLSGGFAGLTALRWVSSLVTTGADSAACQRRNVRACSRIPQIAPVVLNKTAPTRELAQAHTRFDKREAQRVELELTEEEMQGMERELEHMLPPLAEEPVQSLRVNLLVAADCMGTVHVWNLDEELHRHNCGNESSVVTALGWPADFATPSRASARSLSSCSESRRSSVGCAVELSPGATPTRSSTKRKALLGGASATRDSGSGHTKKTERGTKSRRTLGGLGLAEARESRSRMSELPANTILSHTGGAVSARKSQQRPSMGRTSCEERDATAPLLASHKSHVATSPSRTSGQEAPSHRARKDAAVVPLSPSKASATGPCDAAPATTPTKKAKKARPSLQESSPSLSSRASQQPSPSRGSLQRSSASPGRHAEGSPLFATQSGLRPRASPQRGGSLSLGAYHHNVGNNSGTSGVGVDLAMAAQTSKCQIRLSEGAAINDMVVDLPRTIQTTLRRLRSSSASVLASWQHRPTEAEMDARVLENEFEELTEEKALFFAFQQLELYVGVDGAVTAMRCVPEWLLPDHDGRELFKQRCNAVSPSAGAAGADGASLGSGSTASAATHGAVAAWMADVVMPQRVSMDGFALQMRRRLLDVHVQPVAQLFLDSWQGRVWIARQDGFVSMLSTKQKELVSRMAHPSSDALLPPVPAQEWAKCQAQWMARSAEEAKGRPADAGMAGFGLECHKECKGMPPNHLTEVLPMGTRRQRALMILFASSEQQHTSSAELHAPSYKRRLSLTEGDQQDSDAVPPRSPCKTTAAANSTAASTATPPCGSLLCLDGQSDLRSDFKTRLGHQWRWLQELQLCRAGSRAACQAQRRRYYALCDGISHNVAHVIQELGDYATLSQMRACFAAWKDHRALYGHTHLMRRQRTARLQRERPLAQQLESFQHRQLLGAFFVRWMGWAAERRRCTQNAALERFARAAVASGEAAREHSSNYDDGVNATAAVPGRGLGGLHHHRQRCHQRRPLPTAAMMAQLHFLSAARPLFAEWRSWAATSAELHRQQARETAEAATCRVVATPLLALKRSVSSPLTTPSRCARPEGYGNFDEPVVRAVEGVLQDMVTPCRPCRDERDVYAPALSWTPGQRSTDEALALPPPLPSSSSSRLWGLPASVEPFMAAMAELLRSRVYVFHFSDARSSTTSVLDESWTVILDNAESGADGDSDDERRFSVFRFALLPLLQGLISTADDVLPNLFDRSVAEEVLSMLVGIVLAMDYVTAGADCLPLPWMTNEFTDGGDGGARIASYDTPLMNAFDASLTVLRMYAVRAFRTDPEAAEVLRGLAKSRKVLAQFLDFAMERAASRRMEQF